jgi:enoyl-CoA hydratase/carnithine racemase
LIDLQRDGDVVVLQMRDGENRFNRDSIAALNAALDEVEGGDGRPGLVTVGEGKFYSNGLDLTWMTSDEGQAETGFIDSVLRLFARLLVFPLPTAAAMNGHAFAGGLMMALAHDQRVMRADRGFCCLPEIDLGLPLHPGMTALIQSRLPSQTAHEAIVSGRRFGGVEACTAGIVQDVGDEGEVIEKAIARVASHVGKDRATMTALKAGLYAHVLRALGAEDLIPG